MSRTVLVTGATGLIGTELVRRFLKDGYRVVGTSRREAALAAFRETLKTGSDFVGVVADLGADGGDALVRELAARGLLPQAVVNNAFDMANQKLDPSGHPRRAQWVTEFDYAVVAPYQIATSLAEIPGSPLDAVVNIASMYGIVPRNPALYDNPTLESPIHYGVAKAAMIHLTRELAVRLAPKKIRVNAVSFGGVEGRASGAFKARYAKLCPAGRMLAPEETAGAVAMLASADASAITGQNIVVDGGFTVW
jgi:NAD(P)-dependent dehydrogenase (short-subunit alcohol dehydrogenase family)